MGAKREGKDWKYSTGTEAAVKGALLALLEDKPLSEIGVSELAREAHVSRSTFYGHFDSPADAYSALVSDFSAELAPVMDQVTCTRDGASGKGKPFCACVRDGGEFAPALKDDMFLREFLSDPCGIERHDLFDLLTEAGYSVEQARAVCTFQLAGCFHAARSCPHDIEWPQVKATLDRFILGGIAACLAVAKRPDA